MQNHVTALTNTKNIASQAGQTKVEGCRRRRRGNVHKKEEKGLHRAFVFCPETECKYKYNHKNENTKEKYTNIMTNNIELWSQKIYEYKPKRPLFSINKSSTRGIKLILLNLLYCIVVVFVKDLS